MNEESSVLEGVFQSLIEYARANHAEEIDKAYEYFWEEDYPEDFLSGTALDIAFVNFEDWLICDYKTEKGETLIDLYIKEFQPPPKGGPLEILYAVRESVISLYEATSSPVGFELKDLLLGSKVFIKKGPLNELKAGDTLATRFIWVPDRIAGGLTPLMGRCVYPYNRRIKDTVMGYINKQFNRYIRNENPNGAMKQFLKEEAYIFNTIWINSLFKLR